MVEEFEVDLDSDTEINDESHKKLLGAVSRIYHKKRVERPERTEASYSVSEYHVGVGGETEATSLEKKVSIEALAQNLTHNVSLLADIQRSVPAATLLRPIEKIYSDRVKRSVGYDNVKNDVSRWDPIVRKNRLSDQLTFPLAKPPPVTTYKPLEFLTTFSKPTELELKMAEALGQSPVAKAETQTEEVLFKLSLKEIIQKRKMLARIKAQESYKMAKLIKQNQIKSKSYRRLARKEKEKQQLKAFEELKKTDPEGALACLERVERERVEERASLRHKNTGKWAKGKAVRAKYDRQARKELSEQLAKSRELTQKRYGLGGDSEDSEGSGAEEGESEEERNMEEDKGDKNNPWTRPSDTVEGFVAGFKEFSARQGQPSGDSVTLNTAALNTLMGGTCSPADNPPPAPLPQPAPSRIEPPPLPAQSQPTPPQAKTEESKTECSQPDENLKPEFMILDRTDGSNKELKTHFSTAEHSNKSVPVPMESNDSQSLIESVITEGFHSEVSKKASKLKRKRKKVLTKSGVWDVVENTCEGKILVNGKTEVTKLAGLEKMFERAEDALEEKVRLRSKQLTQPETKKTKREETEKEEEGEENKKRGGTEEEEVRRGRVEELVGRATAGAGAAGQEKDVEGEIDPTKYLEVRPRHLVTQAVDVAATTDLLDDPLLEHQTHQANLEQAFSDDSVLHQFTEEKEEEKKEGEVGDVELGLPGWGCWAGTGIDPARPRRRKVLRAPKVKRKDANMPTVILRDEIPEAVRKHQVSSLPFPFSSVKEYEASIRAPMGSTWLPHTAQQVLTRPPVLTKLGTIIQPMDSSQLQVLEHRPKQSKSLKLVHPPRDPATSAPS